jgi:hypothetical protein
MIVQYRLWRLEHSYNKEWTLICKRNDRYAAKYGDIVDMVYKKIIKRWSIVERIVKAVRW